MKNITVSTKTCSYKILIGRDILDHLSLFLNQYNGIKSICIVTEDRVAKYHLNNLLKILEHTKLKPNILVIRPGENSKNWSNIQKVTEWLISKKIERGDFIIGLGGGVIGDLVGFAASIALRGIKVIHIPTSLLAQVDSAIGGKTSINSIHGKNLIGTFHQPALVLSDVAMLRTLSKRDFRSGYGEVVKYALIKDKNFFDWLERQDFSNLQRNQEKLTHVVEISSQIKSTIVEKDETEQGIRALLNFGHTFGHALEAATGYSERLLHGEAVVLGSCLALSLSYKLNLIDQEQILRIEKHLITSGFKTKIKQLSGANIDLDLLMNLMYQDKKVTSNQLNFVLLNKIGEGILMKNVDPENVKHVIQQSLK
ncbi:MAG: 3-dehydroquinate synthase [Paracoccaceae bacterium]|nr:3-dehydroquinate synthase [Paracoccaceae bacterium]